MLSSMCRSKAEGNRRCANSSRLEKLNAADLAPSTNGAPSVDWAKDDLQPLWQKYDRDQVCVALETVEAAAGNDGRTYRDMGSAAAAAGAQLHGAVYRIKSPESLARKISTKMEAADALEEQPSAQETAARITDVTRYTALSAEHDQIVPTSKAVVADLEARGWQVIEAEHSYMSGNPYKGLHLLIRHQDGQVAELQIQSARSQEIKDRAHVLYNISRDTSRPTSERRQAAQENKRLYDDLPAPAGLDTLDKLGSVLVRKKRYS